MISKRDGLFIIIIAFLLIVTLHTCDKSKRVESTLLQSQEQATIWKDKYGRSNAELVVTKTDYNTFKKISGNLIDSLRKINIKPRTVTNVVTVTKNTRDTITIVRGKPFGDNWATFNFLDNDKLAYTFFDSLALVTHKKGYGFLNLKTKYVTRAISFNPNSTITGLTSVEIIPKQRRITLGFFAGYGMQLSGGSINVGPTVGIGLNARLF